MEGGQKGIMKVLPLYKFVVKIFKISEGVSRNDDTF